jgi:hypothetical protein
MQARPLSGTYRKSRDVKDRLRAETGHITPTPSGPFMTPTAAAVLHLILSVRLKIDSRAIAAIHVKGHRHMLMDDHPRAVRLAVANRCAHPNIGVFADCPLPGNAIETMAEGNAPPAMMRRSRIS